MNWDLLKFADGVDRERRRLELSGLDRFGAIGALLREIVSVVAEAEQGLPVPQWMIDKHPELDAEHSRRMGAVMDRLSPRRP